MPLLERFFGVLAPHDCLVCGRESKLVCDWCAHDAFPVIPSRCFRCKRLTADFAVCDSCRKQTILKHVWLRTDYDKTAKDLLHAYKYERAQAAAPIIAAAIEEILSFLPPDTLVIPVPTATNRVRERGYDHALLLARSLARRRRYEWMRAVTRVSQARQVGSGRQKRLAQLKDSFLIAKPALVHDRQVLIVDDVVTTGSTLDAMALALKQAGVKSINAVVFAQKQ